ncbi:putative E3 ubiquitin-protein ligase LIN-1 isoform X1 [Typha angustifolia]|uniref:putative E3 ubiquitin-protein ligase LIN-1 isoform X1 n=1 Tax=Typha angustifolia TaxID=59011 RepID=UPI003C2FE887
MAPTKSKPPIPMEPNDLSAFLISTVGSFLHDLLLSPDLRKRHREQCAERLAAAAAAADADVANSDVRYSEQAVLANLDWGIDAVEEAISPASHPEARLARLDHAERMLRVPALLDPAGSTAGVPNSYLSAWAHLHLASLAALRGEDDDAARNALNVFDVNPFFARVDFAPELWETLFLPHMASTSGWYAESRYRIVMAVPDAADLSITAEQLLDESVVSLVTPEQVEKLQDLERRCGEALNHSTRLFAKYYKEVVGNETVALPPIAEPPMTPQHERSRSIPNYVKFGPILPTSAGFLPACRNNQHKGGDTRVSAPSEERYINVNFTEESEIPAQPQHLIHEVLPEGKIFDTDSNRSDLDLDSVAVILKRVAVNNTRSEVVSENVQKVPLSTAKSISTSLRDYSSVDSPRTPSPNLPVKKSFVASKKEHELLLLSSNRFVNRSPKMFSPKGSGESLSPVSLSLKLAKKSDGLACAYSVSSTSAQKIQNRCRYNSCSLPNQSHASKHSQVIDASYHVESEDEACESSNSVTSSDNLTLRAKPPKDFVCPITGQLFSNPVTLETGQTYEGKAIQEWVRRGNATCPITRQLLSSTILPKTNYVLKRLVTSWLEENSDPVQEVSYSETTRSTSPVFSKELHVDSASVPKIDLPLPQKKLDHGNDGSRRNMRKAVSSRTTNMVPQASSQILLNQLKPYISCLCTSENLQECEESCLYITRILKESKSDHQIHAYLSMPTVVNGFVEILLASANRDALRASINVLVELVSGNEAVGETLHSADSIFGCLSTLLIDGLAEAAIIIYLLRPTYSELSNHNIVPSLVQLIMNENENMDTFRLGLEPKDAAIEILLQILSDGDDDCRSVNALRIISENGILALLKCLEISERKLSVICILSSCMRADKSCRNFIANRIELASVLELFHSGNDSTRDRCIDFISELVCSNRRTFSNQILQIIKDEGAFSTMHTFLVYLQTAPIKQQLKVASILLQLDLLIEPRKMSIYREEAIDAILGGLKWKDLPICQIALETLTFLSGRITVTGKSLTEAWLLRIAGITNPYDTLMEENMQRVEDVEEEMMVCFQNEGEEKATSTWERRVAFVLCNHDNGVIFKALEECFTSNSLEVAKSCLVTSTWLTYMLTILPDTGLIPIASNCLLDQFVDVLQSSRNHNEKVLATLALKTFISDPDSLKGIEAYATQIFKKLRKLKSYSLAVEDMLKLIVNISSVDTAEFLSCTELLEIDSSANGPVQSLVHSKELLFSGHSDGTIKVWKTEKRALKLIQEVHRHSKAIMCLYIPTTGDKLYSGSHDKTIRVWTIEQEEICTFQVYDMKEPVNCLATNTHQICYASPGNGVKVYKSSGVIKHVNFNKNVKCLAMTEKSIYCGCTGYSIQEVDLSSCTSNTLYSGTKKLLGKQTIQAICIHKGILFAGGSSVDGIAGKAFSLSTTTATGSFSTGLDIHSISANDDFVFTGTKCGVIEVWLRERLTRVASLRIGGGASTKITTLAADADGELLFAGSTDGKIQVWSLD